MRNPILAGLVKYRLEWFRATFAIILIVLYIVGGSPFVDPRACCANDPNGVTPPFVLPDSEVSVLCFLGTECPLARLYSPRLGKLAAEYSPHSVAFVGVNSNVQDSPDEIAAFASKHEIGFVIHSDPKQSLADQYNVTRTSEVVVLDRQGTVRYRGRIDDQYEPGIARSIPTKHDLRDAIDAMLAGKPVPNPETQAVGCVITRIHRKPKTESAHRPVTFTSDVAPLLNKHCVECHRSGEIGPFALEDFDEVVGWGEMIVEVVEQQRMPPWHADPKVGEFVGARHLPVEDRELLTAWVEQGMPQGNPNVQEMKPEWASGWHLPEAPEIELAMRDRPFQVPSEGTVEYQYFVVDLKWNEDRWVRAAQVVPGNAAVVHHAIVFVRPPDDSSSQGIGWLGGYVPGQRATSLPAGHARRIPAGSKLIFQMHYTPNGKKTEDTTRVGVWFADPQSITEEVFTLVAIDHDFEIPPGADNHTVRFQMDGLPSQSRLLAAMPHMHLRGKSFQLFARRGDQLDPLLSVPRYDFNWQHWYQYQHPLSLDGVDALELEVQFDNSRKNPVNPDPSAYVHWGDQTWNEMAVGFIDVARTRGQSDRPRQHRVPVVMSTPKVVEDAINAAVEKFLSDMDKNSDGKVQRDEAPIAFRRYGFSRFDSNRDEVLDRAEIASAAADRL